MHSLGLFLDFSLICLLVDHSLPCRLCLCQCLTLVLVAFAPVVPLAVDRAVKSLLARAAALVLHGLALGTRAERANVEKGAALVLLLRADSFCKVALLFEPLQRGVVHP